MTKFEYEVEVRKPIQYPELKGWNDDIVETAGFIPLAVRFKQMEQAGYRARFSENEFTSRDISDMYLNHPEFDITPEDDFEEAQEKFMLRQQYIKEITEKVRKRNAGFEEHTKDSAERAADNSSKEKGANEPEEKK